jgi:hypothetical protein
MTGRMLLLLAALAAVAFIVYACSPLWPKHAVTPVGLTVLLPAGQQFI